MAGATLRRKKGREGGCRRNKQVTGPAGKAKRRERKEKKKEWKKKKTNPQQTKAV
jgi:hypothetical protein